VVVQHIRGGGRGVESGRRADCKRVGARGGGSNPTNGKQKKPAEKRPAQKRSWDEVSRRREGLECRRGGKGKRWRGRGGAVVSGTVEMKKEKKQIGRKGEEKSPGSAKKKSNSVGKRGGHSCRERDPALAWGRMEKRGECKGELWRRKQKRGKGKPDR